MRSGSDMKAMAAHTFLWGRFDESVSAEIHG
jgi:hypothetical protein